VFGGASQSYTFTPEAGYRVLDVLVRRSQVGVRTTFTFANVQSNHMISATFTPNVYTVTATAGGQWKHLAGWSDNSESRQQPDLHDHAGSRYQVQNVVVDGVSKGAITTYLFAVHRRRPIRSTLPSRYLPTR